MSTTPDSLPADFAPLGGDATLRERPWLSAAGTFAASQTRFAVVALEFFLLVLLVKRYHLESQTFHRVMVLSFAAFLAHHYLPMAWKMPFFAAVSVFATVAVVDDISILTPSGPGPALVALGLVLLAICHLPIPFAARVTLLLVSGVGLSLIRANYQWFPTLEGVWPVLASMFMFRVMIYMYDLKHQSTKFSPARGIAYFFMAPNACFPLFPIVDYKTFNATYYNDEPARIYQTGIKWMFRGIVQLILYRAVYQFGVLNVADVRDLGDVAEFMVATYLMYLKVSGQFHLIVGLLHMFGFNLPETHHLYLLASSFTDFWRRINIYWKDFIMKIFFYPAFFALREIGTVRAIALGTVAAFFATWALHSWQWFWFVGEFLVTWQDISFWTILALLVLVNAVIEAIRGRKKSLTPPKFDSKARLIVALKTAATFVVICVLWTMWSSQSAGELQVLAESAMNASIGNVLAIVAFLTLIGAAGAIWGNSAREDAGGKSLKTVSREPDRFWSTSGEVALASAVLFGLVLIPGGSNADGLLTALRQDQLNSADKDWQRRGYYEELDAVRGIQNFWGNSSEAPPGWTEKEKLFRERDDFIHREMIPGAVANLCGAKATVNRWGMRDRDYSKEKSRGTYRIALFGSSHEVGSGVRDQETFENIVEDRLNDPSTNQTGHRYEILNFSVGGFSLFEKLRLLEETGFEFDPDVVLFSVCAADRRFILEHLAGTIQNQRSIPYAYLTELFDKTFINANLSPVMVHHRLDAYVPEMYSWIFHRLKEESDKRAIKPLILYRPDPNQDDQRDSARHAELLSLAREAGIQVLDLNATFDRVDDRTSLYLAEWDRHTSAAGHKLLADELFAKLTSVLEEAYISE